MKRNFIDPGYQVTKEEEDLGETDPQSHIEIGPHEPLLPSILSKLIEKRKIIKREIQ